MKKLILLAFALTACASANSNYIGDGMYEINASGAPAAGAEKVRRMMYKEAFEVCAKEGKGFKLMGAEDTSHNTYLASSNYNNTTTGAAAGNRYAAAAVVKSNSQGSSNFNTFRNHGARAVVKCEGPIDERMAREVASQ